MNRFKTMIKALQELDRWWDSASDILNEAIVEDIYKPLETYFNSYRADGYDIAFEYACGLGVNYGEDYKDVESTEELYEVFFKEFE